MPPVERLSHPLSEAPLIRGASTLTNSDEVYEMTREHIRKGVPLGILIDQEGMTLKPTGDVSKTQHGVFRLYALRNGNVNPHIRLRFETPPPEKPAMGTIILGIPEFDAGAYSGFTVVEAFSK